MLTVGTVSRLQASLWFPFLAEDFRGRRTAIRELTHGFPELVFWIYPNGQLLNAGRSHRSCPPPGHEHILKDEPDYDGFLRGRVVRTADKQLIVSYCRPEALASLGRPLSQFLHGMEQTPMPVDEDAIIISDNGDIYGTLRDLWERRYT